MTNSIGDGNLDELTFKQKYLTNNEYTSSNDEEELTVIESRKTSLNNPIDNCFDEGKENLEFTTKTNLKETASKIKRTCSESAISQKKRYEKKKYNMENFR